MCGLSHSLSFQLKGLQVFQRIDEGGSAAESLNRMRKVLKDEQEGKADKQPPKKIGNTWQRRRWSDVVDSENDKWYPPGYVDWSGRCFVLWRGGASVPVPVRGRAAAKRSVLSVVRLVFRFPACRASAVPFTVISRVGPPVQVQ